MRTSATESPASGYEDAFHANECEGANLYDTYGSLRVSAQNAGGWINRCKVGIAACLTGIDQIGYDVVRSHSCLIE